MLVWVEQPWRAEAACHGCPTDWFFPPEGLLPHQMRQLTKQGRAVCATCPVTQQCLDFALSIPVRDPGGIWGGTSEKQRRLLRTARHREQQLEPDAEVAA